jgi:hypothetical protein
MFSAVSIMDLKEKLSLGRSIRQEDMRILKARIHIFLLSLLNVDEWSAPRFSRVTLYTRWTEGWVETRAGLDVVTRRKIQIFIDISTPLSIPYSPCCQSSSIVT